MGVYLRRLGRVVGDRVVRVLRSAPEVDDMAGSLLDGDDFSSIGASRSPKKGGGSTDKAMMIKIGVIIVCLGGAGYLIARQSGMFDSKPQDTRTQEEILQEDQEYERQEKIREEMQKLPQYSVGDA